MNIAIFLDEVMTINGPLMMIPRSHTVGVLKADYDKGTTSYGIWSLKEGESSFLWWCLCSAIPVTGMSD